MTPDGYVVGGGILLPGGHVATCAHVVRDALCLEDTDLPPAPAEVVVGTEDGQRRAAGLLAEHWDDALDIAVLTLRDAHPVGAAVQLGRVATGPRPRRVRVHGYPQGVEGGLTARAEVVGRGGTRLGQLQVDIDRSHPVPVEGGFSGCGVIDDLQGRVVGILTSRVEGLIPEDGRTAFMIPVEQVPFLLDLLTAQEEATLAVRRWLSGLRFGAIRSAFDEAMHGRADHPREDFGTALDAYDYLADLTPDDDGLPRDAIFLEEVRARGLWTGEGLSETIDRHHRNTLAEEEWRGLMRRSRAPRPPERAEAPWLIVCAEPVEGDLDGPERYTVTSWTVSGGPRPGYSRGSGRTVTRETLEETVLEMVDAAKRLPGAVSHGLNLQFVLPFSLLAWQVTRWGRPAPITGIVQPIGGAHEIVLRCWELLYNDHPQWRDVHAQLRKHQHALSARKEGDVYWVSTSTTSETARRTLNTHLADEELVACVLGADPRTSEGYEQLGIALTTGIPIIVWLRGDAEGTELFHRHVRPFLGGDRERLSLAKIEALPHALKKFRTGSEIGSRQEGSGYDPLEVSMVYEISSQMPDPPDLADFHPHHSR
ncbi:trypsin-like peptidase domain-containing protein [Marinactinospora thermotolerans]|nr:trypsin-like peptidase domain-containing protein [Marinactinospora thermotolerans]